MPEAVVVALITLVGNGMGCFFANRATQNLMSYRLNELERKVEKHNNVVERTYKIEQDVSVIKEHIETMEKVRENNV